MKNSVFVFLDLFRALVSDPASLDSPYLQCYGSDHRWEWATQRAENHEGHYFKLSGYFVKNHLGQDLFLSDGEKFKKSDLENTCRDTLANLPHPFELTNIRVGATRFTPSYEIRFLAPDRKEVQKSIRKKLQGFFDEQYLPFVKEVLDHPSRNQVLSSTVIEYLKANPDERKHLVHHVNNAVKYANLAGDKARIPLVLAETDPLERVTEFLQKYSKKTDYEILALQFLVEDIGAQRGPDNSYIDIISGIFHGQDLLPAIYDSGNKQHKLLNAFLEASPIISFLKGLQVAAESNSKSLGREELQADLDRDLIVINAALTSLKNLAPLVDQPEQKQKIKAMSDILTEAILFAFEAP